MPTPATPVRHFDLSSLGRLTQHPERLRDWLNHHLPELLGPSISAITPASGPRGTVITLTGSNFSAQRLDNTVTVGGAAGFVLSATSTQLRVLTGPDTDTGPVEITIGGRSVTSSSVFTVTGHPSAGDDTTDGPPVVTTGVSEAPGAGDVNPIGTIRVLAVMLQPNDLAPANAATTRTAVNTAWNQVRTYYNQASYGQTQVTVDMTTFATLDGAFTDFYDAAKENYRKNQLGRIAAIGAKAAVDQGFTLNNYQMIAYIVFTNGTFVRAWGGGAQSTFAYDNGKPVGDPNRVSINLTASQPINTLFINESANWGRYAHEFGHNVVSAPTNSGSGTATLGEDVYGSDLVDPSAATAQSFELMGDHDTHPLFSGYHLDKLGYYQAANVRTLSWDRNPHSETIDIVAHGLTQDADPNRVHLVKVRVSDALTYYIQVRQRPGTTGQIFDDQIPFGASANQGGVVVTRAIAGQMYNNQETRFISLMHDNRVLLSGESAEDPARALRITVVDDAVQARPLVCRVRVEWAQNVTDDPAGAFDLRIEPWDANYSSPDIWVDRDPFGSFDSALDGQGRPTGNGDRPKVGAINRINARVHVSGAAGATNVKVTHYAISPPGVGDNGNWAPIATTTVGAIPVNGYADVTCNWVPVVGQHTCLKSFASAQLGEISGGNNSAQENVFDFISAGNSPCEPVVVKTAVRNPVDERGPVLVELHGVPLGWMAALPHSWVWLEGRAEREIEVAIWPTEDPRDYLPMLPSERDRHQRAKLPVTAPVRVSGSIPRSYDVSVLESGESAASRFYPIGGVFYRTHVRLKSSIKIDVVPGERVERDPHEWDQARPGKYTWVVRGRVDPPLPDQQVVVEVSAPSGKPAGTFVGRTGPAGEVTVWMDLEKAVEAHGDGTYTVRASLFDADTLNDAEANPVQFTV